MARPPFQTTVRAALGAMFWLGIALALGRVAARSEGAGVFAAPVCLASVLMAAGSLMQRTSLAVQMAFWTAAAVVGLLPAMLILWGLAASLILRTI